MNAPAGPPDDAYIAALRSYRSNDPISLHLLVEAIEGRARRMRADAVRKLIGGALRWTGRVVYGVAAASEPLTRRERLSS